MKLIKDSLPYIVETPYDEGLTVKVVLSPLFDKYIIDYIEKHNLKAGVDIKQHMNNLKGKQPNLNVE